jgi:hypothetical protein
MIGNTSKTDERVLNAQHEQLGSVFTSLAHTGSRLQTSFARP